MASLFNVQRFDRDQLKEASVKIYLRVAILFGCCCLAFMSRGVPAEGSPAPVDEIDSDVPTDDPLFLRPAPFEPRQPRSELEDDQLAASALFLRGRILYQREKYKEALRCYQRAFRRHPDGVSILREIVPLAFELKHNEEAARYAVIMAEQAPRDAILLRRLAQHLMDDRDYERALSLYEKSFELQKNEKSDARTVLARMEIGRLYFLQKQHEKAAQSFAIVREAMENPEKFELSEKIQAALIGTPKLTYTLFGETFLEAGRLEDAALMFEKAFAEKSDQPQLAFHLARVEMKNGRPEAARDQLDKYLLAKQSAAGAEPYELLEKTLTKIHGQEAAQDKLKEKLTDLHKDDPSNEALGYFLADKYRQWKEFDEAAKLYEGSLAASPTLDGYQGLAETYRQLKNEDKLLSTLGAAVLRLPSIEQLGEVAEQIANNEKEVQKLIDLARKRQKEAGDMPSGGEALAVAQLAILAKKYDVADEMYAVAAAANKERQAAIYENWGLAMFMAEQNRPAIHVFQKAIDEKIAPRFDGDFYYYLAAALEFDGQTEKALAAARKAAELKKDSPHTESRYAWVLYHAKRYDEAEKEYRKFIEKHDANHASGETRDAVRQARMVLSNIAIHLDQMDEAEEWIEQVLDEYPEDIGALNDLGYLWSDQGKHLHRSLAMIEKAVASEPDNVAYRDSLGWAHYRLGQYRQAIEHLERAASAEDEPDGVILDHLGDAYHKAGRMKDAVKTWQRAAEVLEKAEDEEHLKKTKAKLQKHSQP